MVSSNAKMISLEQQRRMIPDWAFLLFEETTDDGLIGMTEDPRISTELRLFVRLELEYRQATSVLVDFAPRGNIRRRSFATEADAARLVEQDEREAAAIAQAAGEARARWSAAPRTIRDGWAAAGALDEHLTEGPALA